MDSCGQNRALHAAPNGQIRVGQTRNCVTWEDPSCAMNDALVPVIETEDDRGPWVYQVFDTVPKPMPTGRLAKWQILLTEFDIIYVTQTAMKAQALTDHLAENPVDEDYEPLKTYFPDEEVMNIDELEQAEKSGWTLFLDGAANMKGVGIGAIQVRDQHAYCNVIEEEIDGESWFHDIKEYIRVGVYPTQATGDQKRTIRQLAKVMHIDELEQAEKSGWTLFFDGAANMKGVGIVAVLISETGQHYPVTARLRFYYKVYADPLQIQVRDQHAYCNVIEEEIDREPWFHDIKEYIRAGVYPTQANGDQKRTIRRLASSPIGVSYLLRDC
ncbi:uncharacterized protein [Nicotiana sylvestris]|uniref:uncharacterized protein n=1 Tax=Nicotiana sylvestris TaxID=4096 RepID=UPI00388CCB89